MSFFGRSKSKHRKGGEVTVGGLKISNPTPLGDIRVNGPYVDLRETAGVQKSSSSTTPQLPPLRSLELDKALGSGGHEDWLGLPSSAANQFMARGAAPMLPKQSTNNSSEVAAPQPNQRERENLVPAAWPASRSRPPQPPPRKFSSPRPHPPPTPTPLPASSSPSSSPQPPSSSPQPPSSSPQPPSSSPQPPPSSPQPPSLPSHPSTPSTPGIAAKNFSRKIGPSPTPDSAPQIVATPAAPLPAGRRPALERTSPEPVSPLTPVPRPFPPAIQQPPVLQRPASDDRPVSRGRQKIRESATIPTTTSVPSNNTLAKPEIKSGTQTRDSSAGSIYRLWAQTRTTSPASQRSIAQKRNSTPPPSTAAAAAAPPVARHLRVASSSSSIYSRASQDIGRDSSDIGVVIAPLATTTRSEAPQPRATLPRLDTQPEQLHSVGFFNPGGLTEAPPASPLLPTPPRRRSSDVAAGLDTPAPVAASSSPDSAPKLLLYIEKADTNDLSNLFSDSTTTTKPTMPGRINTSVVNTTSISSPKSPEKIQLPSYLGPLQDVQTASPISPTDSDERPFGKPSLGRKVSTRLRGLVSSSQSQSPPSPRRRAVSKDAISTPAPIPEGSLVSDPEIARIKAQFDIGLASMPRAAQMKVDEWNYNPSARTSKSSVLEVQKGQSFSGRNSPASTNNPGLTSPRSSSERDPALDSPVTPPHDDRTFAALCAGGSEGSLKQPYAPALRQQSYQSQSSGTQRSLDVPMFLDTEAESQSITEEPAEQEEHAQRPAGLTRSNSIMTSEVERQLEGRSSKYSGLSGTPTHLQLPKANHSAENGDIPLTPSTVSTMRSPALSSASASTAATSIPSPAVSPGLPRTPRSTNARPPFAGDRKLLRSATMSSRPGGSGGPRPTPKIPPPARTPKQNAINGRKTPVRSNTMAETSSPPRNRSLSPPINKHLHRKQLVDEAPRPSNRQGNEAFSFAASIDLAFGKDDESMIFPDDSISVIGTPAGAHPSSRPVHQHLEASETDWQPTPRSVQQQQQPGHEAEWQPQLNLRPARSYTNLPTRVGADFTTPIPPETSATTPPEDPGVKRSKSYGEGLRRAFSRRKPEANKLPPMPPPTPSPSLLPIPTVPEEPFSSGVSGPQGMGSGPSQASMARWNTALAVTRTATTSTRTPRNPTITTALKLTAEDRSSVVHKSGTLFIKTVDKQDGEVRSHHMKPKKGYAVQEQCAFCGKGPFANMWVCLDECRFVVCRMCCNERVQEGEAELF